MVYKVYIADNTGPRTGLSPSWESLKTVDGAGRMVSAPSITEIGGGWYRFELTYGTVPWDVPDLVGVIDAGEDLIAVQRYIPIAVSLRDLGFAFLTNTRKQTIATGVIDVLEDDGETVLLRLTPSQADGDEIITPSGVEA